MRKTFIMLLSIVLCMCMLFGALPISATEIGNAEDEEISTTYKEYDDAENGDELYTVNFNFDEVYTNNSSSAVTDAIYAISGENGEKITFTDKAAGDHYYGGHLKKYPIVGNVYTISYYIENTCSTTHRAAAQFFSDGQRVGLVNGKVATDQLYIQLSGSAGMKLDNTVQRKVDTANNNRRNYKVVIDGVNMVAKFYALNTSDEYEWIVNIDIDFNSDGFQNYLSIGLFCYDAVASGASVSMGDVVIKKGDSFNTQKSEYQNLYDNTSYGAILYDINFNDIKNNTNGWNSFRGKLNITNDAVSADGNSLSLNYTSSSVNQYIGASFPDKNMANYGSYTYEFYVDSDMRVGLNVLGNTAGGSCNAIGFSYFNSTVGCLYSVGDGWQYCTYNYFNGVTYRGAAVVETKVGSNYNYDQTPYTGENIDCNVKIEVDTVNKKITNYILKEDGSFKKTASIGYEGCAFYPIIYPHAYNQAPNAKFSNMVIKKGLTATGENNEARILDLTVDGVDKGYSIVTQATATLPEFVEKDYFTAKGYECNGEAVTSMGELLDGRYNKIELTTVYEPVPVQNGIELRGFQYAEVPDTATTTSVRIVAVLDSLEFSEVGFKIAAKYTDVDGVEHVGKNTLDKSSNMVYTAITAAGETVTATELGGKYIVAILVNDVPIGDGITVTFDVTPYTVAKGATKNPATGEGYDYGEAKQFVLG